VLFSRTWRKRSEGDVHSEGDGEACATDSGDVAEEIGVSWMVAKRTQRPPEISVSQTYKADTASALTGRTALARGKGSLGESHNKCDEGSVTRARISDSVRGMS
jgi:acetamidase/formamidase